MSKRARYDAPPVHAARQYGPKKSYAKKGAPKESHAIFDLPPTCLVPATGATASLVGSGQLGSTSSAGEFTSNVYSVVLNAGIEQGDGGQAGRNLRQITMDKLSLKFTVRPSKSLGRQMIWKLWLIYYKEPSALTSNTWTGDNFFQNTHGANKIPMLLSHSAVDNAGKFKILKSWTGTVASTQDHDYTNFEEYINLKNKVARWNRGNTDGHADKMTEGALILMFTAEHAAQVGAIEDIGTGQCTGGQLASTGPTGVYCEFSSRLYYAP